MKLYEINPYVRFASPINYKAKHNPVKVTDCRIFYVTGGKADIFIENQHYSLEPNSLLYCCGGSEYNIEAPNGFSPICINFDLTQTNNTLTMPISPWKQTESLRDVPVFHDDIEDSPFSFYYPKREKSQSGITSPDRPLFLLFLLFLFFQ